jgi:aminoglycoside phosphotransferase (APT) family kinase protein
VDRKPAVGWLATRSVGELRGAISEAIPELAGRSLVLNDRVVTSNPRYFQGSAVLGGAYVVKFAWSEPAARRIAHEARLLEALANAELGLAVPVVVAARTAPAILITRLVPGEPLSWEAANGLSGRPRRMLVEGLAHFLAVLHDPGTLEAIGPASLGPEIPETQATTNELRQRFGRLVSPSEQLMVEQWCDWADTVLHDARGGALLHGDLHGHNLVCDPVSGALRLVADFETAGPGDPAFDFRYLPGQAKTVDLFLEIRQHYERLGGGGLDIDRVMAWHITTVLGDALWRTEAGVALPGNGGTASTWVEELDSRMQSMITP